MAKTECPQCKRPLFFDNCHDSFRYSKDGPFVNQEETESSAWGEEKASMVDRDEVCLCGCWLAYHNFEGGHTIIFHPELRHDLENP